MRFYEHRNATATSQARGEGATLMSWGPITFNVFPLNIHEYDHHTATDWAEKEIAGTMIFREWVGEDDETIELRGRIFPHHKIGGWPQLERFEAWRRAAMAHQLARSGLGGHDVIGWFVCEELHRGHEYLGPDGIGSQVEFEARFARVPIGDPHWYFPGIVNVLQV